MPTVRPVNGYTYYDLMAVLTSVQNGDTIKLTQTISDFSAYKKPFPLAATGVTLDGCGCGIGGSGSGEGLPGSLFGKPDGSDPVEGLTVKDINISYGVGFVPPKRTKAAKNMYYFGLVTSGVDCTFDNVSVTGSVELEFDWDEINANPDGTVAVGSLAGSLTGECVINNCRAINDGSGSSSGLNINIAVDGGTGGYVEISSPQDVEVDMSVGSFLGSYMGSSLLIKDCVAESNTTIEAFEGVGGIVGRVECGGGGSAGGEDSAPCTIENCTFMGRLIVQWQDLGGIVGSAVNTLIKDCRVSVLDQTGTSVEISIEQLFLSFKGVDADAEIMEYWVCMGGVAGSVTDSEVYRCQCGGCVIGRNLSAVDQYDSTIGLGVGGVVGCMTSTQGGPRNARVSYCTFDGNLYFDHYLWRFTGGIVGWAGGVEGAPADILHNVTRSGILGQTSTANSGGGIVGGAVGCFNVGYNRVCRTCFNPQSASYSRIAGEDKIGGIVGEVLVWGDESKDGQMAVYNNAVTTGDIEMHFMWDNTTNKQYTGRGHRIIGFIPPKGDWCTDPDVSCPLKVVNNYANKNIRIDSDNETVEEYDKDHFTGEEGEQYYNDNSYYTVIVSPQDCDPSLSADCMAPDDDSAYGANRLNGANIDADCQAANNAIDCLGCVTLDLCGGMGAAQNAASANGYQFGSAGAAVLGATIGSNLNPSTACGPTAMHAVQSVIDSLSAMENANNCYLNPASCGPSGFTGCGFMSEYPYAIGVDDPVEYNDALSDDVSRAGDIADSLRKSICCVMNYMQCCLCNVSGGHYPSTRDICLTSVEELRGNAVPNIAYTITKDGTDPPEATSLKTGSDGKMALKDLAAGTYHIVSGESGYPDFHTYDLVVSASGNATLLNTTPDLPAYAKSCNLRP